MVALAAQVRRLRDARGWSAQRLADELAAIGVPLDRSVIANLENGRRASVDIQELLALALALGVTPLDLLVPPEASDGDPYAVTPERTEPVGRVRAWIAGGFLTEPETTAELAKMIATMPPGRAQQISAEWLGQATHDGLVRYLVTLSRDPDIKPRGGLDQETAEREIQAIRRAWRQRGGEPPELPPVLRRLDEVDGSQ